MAELTPYYERDGITIYCGDNVATMRDVISDNSIDLTVTSPPYDFVDSDMVTHSDKGLRDYQGYSWDFVSVAQELWRVTTKGGVAVWVVGDATVNGSETGSSFRQALYFMECGFRLHDTMIYEVAGTGAKGSNKAYWQSFDFMFVFSSGEISTVNRIADKRNNSAGLKHWNSPKIKENRLGRNNNNTIVKNFGIRSNIWRYHIGWLDDSDNVDHTAPFPEALARDHIISWSNPGNLVFDPFLGSGTTLKMAQREGRRGVGIELSEEYCKIAVERLRQPSFFSIPDKPKIKPEQMELI